MRGLSSIRVAEGTGGEGGYHLSCSSYLYLYLLERHTTFHLLTVSKSSSSVEILSLWCSQVTLKANHTISVFIKYNQKSECSYTP